MNEKLTLITGANRGMGFELAKELGLKGQRILVGARRFDDGAQAEYVRFQHAEWALIKIPGQPTDDSDEMLNSLLSLADVMATGYHATRV